MPTLPRFLAEAEVEFDSGAKLVSREFDFNQTQIQAAITNITGSYGLNMASMC
ncbi:MAG: hypothetical protein V1753_08885 [Pseudomonadota bacterium]